MTVNSLGHGLSCQTTLSLRSILLNILSGVMLTAAFPPGRLDFLAWVALVPLLISLNNQAPAQAFRLGFIFGTAHYLTLIYWVVVAIGHYGGLNIFASLGIYVLLCLYLALYAAIFSSLTVLLLRGSQLFLIPVSGLWVGLEYLRATLLTGFPWCLLGYTQFRHLYLIQIADLFGVYGLSALVILVNGLIYLLVSKRSLPLRTHLGWNFLFVALALGGTLSYGHYRLLQAEAQNNPSSHINTLIVQGNIDQSVKWNPAFQRKTMATYQRLTREGFDFKPNLIVWPETSVPFFFQDSPEYSAILFSLVQEARAALIFGSPAYEYNDFMIHYFNRAYLISFNQDKLQHYDKVHLVPFGEYIPLKKILFFIGRLVPAAGDFESGTTITPLKMGDLSLGVLICFEAIFPELSRAFTKAGADVLVNLTNDGWFGMTSAPYQHLSMAAFRAVENRRPLIRSANTGISAFIKPQGEIVAQGPLFREAVLRGRVDVPEVPSTFYARFGDLLAFASLFLSAIKIIAYFWKKWAMRGRRVSLERAEQNPP